MICRTYQIDPYADKYSGWSPYSWTGNNPILNIDPNGMDWYSNQKTGALEFFDKETGYIEGYTYIAADDASYENIKASYYFVNKDASSSLMDEVTVEPTACDKVEDLVNDVVEFASDASRDVVNSFTYVTTGITMPIANAIGGSEVSWAKVYTFDENWSIQGKELDNGTLSEAEMAETIHATTEVVSTFIPAVQILNTSKSIVNKVGNYILNVALKTSSKNVIDYSTGYKKR